MLLLLLLLFEEELFVPEEAAPAARGDNTLPRRPRSDPARSRSRSRRVAVPVPPPPPPSAHARDKEEELLVVPLPPLPPVLLLLLPPPLSAPPPVVNTGMRCWPYHSSADSVSHAASAPQLLNSSVTSLVPRASAPSSSSKMKVEGPYSSTSVPLYTAITSHPVTRKTSRMCLAAVLLDEVSSSAGSTISCDRSQGFRTSRPPTGHSAGEQSKSGSLPGSSTAPVAESEKLGTAMSPTARARKQPVSVRARTMAQNFGRRNWRTRACFIQAQFSTQYCAWSSAADGAVYSTSSRSMAPPKPPVPIRGEATIDSAVEWESPREEREGESGKVVPSPPEPPNPPLMVWRAIDQSSPTADHPDAMGARTWGKETS